MRTLGIDLASRDERTAMAAIVWERGRAFVEDPVTPVSDGEALAAMRAADFAGIDAPFGWPDAVTRALPAFAESGEWPDATNGELRFRLTDVDVHDRVGRWPLSPSSDRIAVPAWRCARLLTEHSPGQVDRLGANGVVEVYPGAALTLWGFERRGYKRGGVDARAALVAEIERRGSGWLDLAAAAERCVASDDALDAVLAALVTRAAAVGLTSPPPDDRREVVRREGWIQLPLPGSFERLISP